MSTEPVTPTALQSRNPYNRASAAFQDPEIPPLPPSPTTRLKIDSPVELQTMRTGGSSQGVTPGAGHPGVVERLEEGLHHLADKVDHELRDVGGRRQSMWDRFRGKDRRKIGWRESARNTMKSSSMSDSYTFLKT